MIGDVIVFDDDCGFCTVAVEWIVLVSSREYVLVGFSELDGGELEGVLPESYEACFHVVSGDGVFSCGRGVRYVVAGGDVGSVVYWLLSLPVVRWCVDWGYWLVAENRGVVSWIGRRLGLFG